MKKSVKQTENTKIGNTKKAYRAIAWKGINMEEKDLILVKQLPIIEQQLKRIGVKLQSIIDEALALKIEGDTEEQIQESKIIIKKASADLNKIFDGLEVQRKFAKNETEKPYLIMLEIYKKEITERIEKAVKELKEKTDAIDIATKNLKEKQVKEYFTEYLKSKNIDFIEYKQVCINVTLTASLKSLKEQVARFIDKVADDLNLIDTQEHKPEILVEYKQTLNVAGAITSVSNRMKAIELEKERIIEIAKRVVETAVEVTKVIEDMSEVRVITKEVEVADPILEMTFKVTSTITKLKELKTFMVERGIKYE